MKCVLLKQDGTVCGADLSLTQKYCANCSGEVEIDESKTKKCRNCSKRLILTAKFCTECRFSFESVTKKTTCDTTTRLRKEDDHEGGNYQNLPDEINIDQTEELDGRDDEHRPEQKTEKQIIETIENTTQNPISYELSAEGDEPEKRGLAVVCSHSEFIHKGHKLEPRYTAFNDRDMMKSLWDLYGCHVIDFTDKGNNFYDTELIKKIDDELKTIGNPEFFVFVLSSHGEEKEEKLLKTDKQGIFQHYFFTSDGQVNTQVLMNKIANIEKLENKLKIFIIQACRSRGVAKYEDGEDHGVEIEIEFEKGSYLSGGQNDGTVHRDAKGCMPHEDEKKNKPDDKRQNDGIDLPDAIPSMSLEDEDEEDENSSSELIIDLPPFEGVPHCDDCVVMFASMSGKRTYSKRNSQKYMGGWLIYSVNEILQKYEKGQQAHILDILVEINRKVGTREKENKRETYEIPNLDLKIKMENLQPVLKNHINKLREICSKHSSKVDKLAAEIDQIGHTEDSLNRIKDETVDLTKKLKQELQLLQMLLKAQSSFFHNLAFDDKDLFLCKMK